MAQELIQPTDPPKEPPDTGNGTGDPPTDPNAGKVTFTPEQQTHIDGLIAERLERAQKKWEAENQEAEQKAKEEAEAQRLKEQQEYQQLAEKHQKKLEKLEPEHKAAMEKLERYENALKKYLEAGREGLPEHLISLLDNLDPIAQLEWLAANAEALGETETPAKKGVPPSPKPKGDGEVTDEERRKKSVNIRQVW